MRRPIEMKYVEERKRRNLVYKKRSKSLTKLTYELSQLCDIQTLMICYDQDGDVVTWPETKQQIVQIAEKFRRCTYYLRQNRHNLYNIRNTEMMKERVEAAKVKAREMPAEKVHELRQAMESKLKEIRGRVRFLTQDSNQDNDDSIVEESITIAETVNNSDNSQGNNQPYTLDLNELAPVENDQDGIYEETNFFTDSEQALANKGETYVKSPNENGSSGLAIPSTEQDENRIARMKHHSLAMEAFNWHRASMNYWASQLHMYHNSDSSNVNLSLSLAPPLTGFVPPPPPTNFIPPPPPTNFIPPPPPTNFIPPPPPNFIPLHSLRHLHNESTLMPSSLHKWASHGMISKNKDVPSGSNTKTGF